MRKPVLSTAALLATLALSACGGDAGTGSEGSELSRAEAVSLNRAILGIGTGVARANAGSASRSHAGTSSGTFSFDFDNTLPCVPSGNVAAAGTLSGSWSSAAQTGQLQATMGVRHQGCAVRTEGGGVVTLNGDPDIRLALTASSNAAGLTALRITETGAFTWNKGDGNSGRCTVDVTAELVAANQVRLSGSVCGFSVDGTVAGTD